MNVQIFDHSFKIKIKSINFYLKIFDTKDVKLVGLKGMPKTIYLNFYLGIVDPCSFHRMEAKWFGYHLLSTPSCERMKPVMMQGEWMARMTHQSK